MSLLVTGYGMSGLHIQNIWGHWVDHIMKKHSRLVLTGAALLRHNGETAASSPGFDISEPDLQNIKRSFGSTSVETVRVNGVTYCIKSRDEEQLVCFNGKNYIIVCKTNYLYIVAKCSSRKTSGNAAEWVKRIAEMIKAKKC